MTRLEIALLNLERAVAYTAWIIERQSTPPYEFACRLEELMLAGQTSEAYHRRVAERERYERIEGWRADLADRQKMRRK